jgi:hypothetical protein
VSFKSIVDGATEDKLSHYASDLQALKDLTDLGNADRNTSQDYAGRFAFELLQNGADAYQKATRYDQSRYPHNKGRVKFVVASGYLLVANTGRPFSLAKEDGEHISSIESISRLGESTKERGYYIGNKGLGFRSIYQICSSLWLLSGGLQLNYDGSRTLSTLTTRIPESNIEMTDYLRVNRTKIPMLKVGFWFDLQELPPEIIEQVNVLTSEKFDTILILRLREDSINIDLSFVWELISNLSEKEILFLDTLERVECVHLEKPEESFTYSLNIEEDSVGSIRTVTRNPEDKSISFLRFGFRTKEMSAQEAQIAFLLENGSPVPAQPADRVFYTYYPAAKEQHGFPFFMHSYFMLSPNREYFNYENVDYIRQNQEFLKQLADMLVANVIPALTKRFPDAFLPELLLPTISPAGVDRLNMHVFHEDPSPELFMSGQYSLTDWLTAKVLHMLREVPMVEDIKGIRRRIADLKLCDDRLHDQADLLLGKVKTSAKVELTPDCLVSCQGRLAVFLRNLRELLPSQKIDVASLAQAVIACGCDIDITPQESASLIILLSELGASDEDSLKEAVDLIRAKRIPVLPCKSEEEAGQNVPFPPFTVKGKASRATQDDPLVFYPVTAREDDEEEFDELIESKQKIPAFCHVFVLHEDVLTSFQNNNFSKQRMISYLDGSFGLRRFRPEGIFMRIAEAILSGEGHFDALEESDKQLFLVTCLGLVERLRLRAAAQGTRNPRPWFMNSSDERLERLYYYLSLARIPTANGWVKGNEIILAGKLSSAGEVLREVYAGLPQEFLSEDNEAPWFREYLNSYADGHRDAEDEDETARCNGRRIFRKYVYHLLGAWDGLRIDAVKLMEMQSVFINPHRGLADHEWKKYMHDPSRSSSSKSYCLHIRSAMIPHLSLLCRDGSGERHDEAKKEIVLKALENALDIVDFWKTTTVYTPKRSTANALSYLGYQLRHEIPWVDPKLRDPLVPADSLIWYTQQNIDPKTSERLSAHYLLSVTSRQVPERLAEVAGMPILEKSIKSQLQAFVDLYEQLCARVKSDVKPGTGFLTLYRLVATRLQQIFLGNERPSEESFRKAKAEELLHRLLKLGVISLKEDQSGGVYLHHSSDLSSVYYDDTGSQNPLFRHCLTMVAFDENCRGLAVLLGIKLISETNIFYDDGSDNLFTGYDDIEQELDKKLQLLKVPLFAFQAFASFIPENQRLVLEGVSFKERWDTYQRIKPEIVETLRISFNNQPTVISPRFQVVLAHDLDKNGRRILFIRKGCLSHDEQVPYRILARPLAAMLGAESQTIAIEMLFSRFWSSGGDDGLNSVIAYLEEQCGVTQGQIAEVARCDKQISVERSEKVSRLILRLCDALEQVYPELILGDEHTLELERRIESGLSLNSAAVVDYLQNKIGIELYRLAEKLEDDIRPYRVNHDNFSAIKAIYRKASLLHLANKQGIAAPGIEFEALLKSYDAISLTQKLKYFWLPTPAELNAPLTLWLAERGINGSRIGYEQLSVVDERLWIALNPGSYRADEQESIQRILKTHIPIIIASVRHYSEKSVVELLRLLEEKFEIPAETLEVAKEYLKEFVKIFSLPLDMEEWLFSNWPEPPCIMSGAKYQLWHKLSPSKSDDEAAHL